MSEADEELTRVVAFLRKWGNSQIPELEDHQHWKRCLLGAAGVLEAKLHREPNLTAAAVDALTDELKKRSN
jgi:hypothetical protein